MKTKVFEALNKDGDAVTFHVVATFDLNGRYYVFYTDMQKMYVGYYETKKIKNITSKEEYDLLNSIYQTFKIVDFKHDFIDYGYTFYKGVNYKMIYDKYDGRRYFFELVDGKYKEISGEVKDHFDKKFNQEVLILTDKKPVFDKDIEPKKYKTKLYVGSTLLTVLIFSSVKFSNLKLENNPHVNEIKCDLEIEPLKVNNVNEITNLIKNNKNIKIDEKAFLLSLTDFYKENINNFDLRTLTNNIPNLKISYDLDNQSKYNLDNTTKGCWIIDDNEIIIFREDEFNPNVYHTLLHEFLHCLSNGGVACDNKDAVALTEGITELIASEYTSTIINEKYVGAYGKQQIYAKMLAEIIGIETIKDAYFKHDLDIIYKELITLTNEKDAYNLVRLINDEMIIENKNSLDYYENKPETIKNLKNIRNDIDKLYAKFYKSKYDIEMENDLLMCSYIDSIRKTNTANYPYYKEDTTFYIEVNKNYVNKKLVSNLIQIDYYYAPGIVVRSNRADYKLLENGKYLNIKDQVEYDTIPEYILKSKLTKTLTDENKIISKHMK
jgi:hypothetical protein